MPYCSLYHCHCPMMPWSMEQQFSNNNSLMEFIDENEEENYYTEMMRQPIGEINRIMRLLNTELEYLYDELARYGINRTVARFIFRFIVAFTINNEERYPGNRQQKATALLNALRDESPWIFLVLRAAGIPPQRVNQIIRTVILFTLENLEAPPAPPENLERLATRITNQIRQETDVFIDLQAYGVPPGQATAIVRTVVLFTLQNIDFNQPPSNIAQKTNQILRQLEASNLDVIEDMESFNIPPGQIRAILRTIIRFTLEEVY